MLKVHEDKKKKTVAVVLSGGSSDALMHVVKRLDLQDSGFKYNTAANDKFLDNVIMVADKLHLNELFMPDRNSGLARCYEDDIYDTEVGKKVALEKAERNYERSFRKAIIRWQVAVLRDVYRISPRTFKEAVDKVTNKE